jgi:hypothetical protein
MPLHGAFGGSKLLILFRFLDAFFNGSFLWKP